MTIHPTADCSLSLKSAGTPYLNQDQDVGNRGETAMIVPNRTGTQFAPPQTAVRANILHTYALLRLT